MKKITYSLMILAAMTAASCSDILEQTPTSQYTDAQVWQDEYLIDSHLADLYAMSVFMINDAVASYGTSPVNMNFSSDNWSLNLGVSAQGEGPIHAITVADECKYSGRGAQTNYLGMKKYGLQSNGTTLRWWSNGYYLNRQLNHFIENIKDSPVSNAVVRESEARFLRAFNYFAMVKRYGGVPIIKTETPLDASDEELYPARSTEKECYDFIIDELLEIADLLEENPEAGRAGKGAALTLLSRVALYAGSIQQFGTVALNGLNGIPQGGDRNYYQISADAAKRVMTECNYSLYKGEAGDSKVDVLRNIFLVKDNSEAIMVKRHEGAGGTVYRWSWDICNCPKPNAWSVGEYALPYYDFVEQFEYADGTSGKIDHEELTSHSWSMDEFIGERDPRLAAWTWTNGSEWPGAIGGDVFGDDVISMYNGIRLADGSVFHNVTSPAYEGVMCYGDQMNEFRDQGNLHTGFGVRKYLDPNADNMTWFIYSTTDYQIFRYAEVLLNYAEAEFELGNKAEALDAINQIRDRAGVAPLTSIDRKAVHHEREIELCFEDHRYWDLRRWREAEAELNGPHIGINYLLDWDSYKSGSPRFWIEIKDRIDDQVTDPTFPSNNYYMPIGDGTVALNPNLVENPGY
jgi:starch-binding outer membrane protein, SusD/RagB family